jgi:hypothetical protein
LKILTFYWIALSYLYYYFCGTSTLPLDHKFSLIFIIIINFLLLLRESGLGQLTVFQFLRKPR